MPLLQTMYIQSIQLHPQPAELVATGIPGWAGLRVPGVVQPRKRHGVSMPVELMLILGLANSGLVRQTVPAFLALVVRDQRASIHGVSGCLSENAISEAC